ncbi:PAS domain-containing sensor histidine kinase [Acidisphaera sp. L21]|uniref:hybrid sensor histidine kinase/response regulator n=1 Tax=Acidisphaera sp. L21 TaxID=1641851 RepID=UPI00131C7783|nr:ATP-binding protein [Acidisphaera sp. L21]
MSIFYSISVIIMTAALVWALRAEFRRRGAAERATSLVAQQHAAALARLDSLFQHSSDSMFIARVDPGGAFMFESVNPIWQKLSGISAEHAVGRSPADCMPHGPAAMVLGAWRRCVRDRQVVHYSYTLDAPDGRRDWEVAATPVLIADDPVSRIIGVGRDVTERHRVEAQLRQAHRMEAVAQLTTGIAHDFNNLLQAILGSIEVLREEPALGQEGQICLAVAEEAARRGATLTHRLLAFSRKQTLDPVLLRTHDYMAAMATQFVGALAPRIEVECTVAADAWPVKVDGDQLAQCLFSLAMNARDAMPDGGTLVLRAENHSLAQGEAAGLARGEYVRFDVVDAGIGMTPDALARAFEPFFTTKPIGTGAGLGLSMVEGFARQSGGGVLITSALNVGTTVSLWLPRAVETAQRVEVKAPPATIQSGYGRVLLVDDEVSVRKMLLLMLKKAGFTAVAVESAEAALALLNAGEGCELLVTDQSMPGMTGCDLIGEASRRWPSLPTMLITGYDKVSGLEQLNGRVTVMRKPFDRAAFLHQVNALIGTATNDTGPTAEANDPAVGAASA